MTPPISPAPGPNLPTASTSTGTHSASGAARPRPPSLPVRPGRRARRAGGRSWPARPVASALLAMLLLWALLLPTGPAPVGPDAERPGPEPASVTAYSTSPPASDVTATPAPALGPVVGPVVQVRVEPAALATSVDQVLANIRNWLMGILAALATVAATWGGVRYVLAGGDPGEVERAKSALRSAALGFVLAALAPLVISVLQGLVTT